LTSILSGNKGTTLVDKAKDLISKNPVTDAVGSVVGAAKDKLTSILNPTTKPATTTPATTTKPATTPATKPATSTTTAPKTGTTPASSTSPLTSAVVNGLAKGLTSGTPGAKAEGEEEVDEEVAEEEGDEDVAYVDGDLNEDITVADDGEPDELVADAEDEFDEAGMDDATMPKSSNAFAGGDAEPTDQNPTSNAEQLQELLSTPEGEDILRQVMISTALESDASLADDPEFEAKIDQAMDQLRGMSTEDISSTINGESPLRQAASESGNALQQAAENSLSNLVGEQPDQAPAETSPLTQVAQEQAPVTEAAPVQQPQDRPASPLTQVAQEQPAPAPEQQPQSPLTQVAQEQPQTPVEQATTAAQETMNSSPLTDAMNNLSNSAAEPEVDYDKMFQDYLNSVGADEPSGYAEPTQTDPGLSVPDFTPPEFEVPDFTTPDFKMPDFEMPDFEMPDFEMPDFEMPDFEMPDFSYGAGDYDAGDYDTGGYESYDEDYKRGGRVMRKAKGGLSSLRHFTPGGGVDGTETDETTSVVGYGQGDASDDTPVGYVDDDLDVDITQGNFEEEDVGDGVVAYRDTDGDVVRVVAADGTNVTRQYVNPNGSLIANTGLRGAPVTTPAVKATTGTQSSLSTRGANEDVDATTVRAATNTNNPATTSFLTDIQNLLTNPTVKTGITGALLAELLSGQTDKSNKGVNVGSYAGFAPRTTPFGMGPAKQVSLGAANALPQDQNTQLMASLGVPGYGFAPPTPTPYTEPVQIQYPGSPPVSQPAPPPNTMVATGGLVHLAGGGMPNMPAPQTFNLYGRQFQAPAPVPRMAPKVQQPGPMPMQPKLPSQTYTGTFAPAPMPKRPLPLPKRYYADGGMAGDEDGGSDPQQMPGTAGQTGGTHYTFGMAVDPLQVLGVRKASGGLSSASEVKADVPVVQGRKDYRRGAYVSGAGDGQSDDIPAMLADGEYVMDAELVSMLGNGSNKAGAKVLDQFRQQIREHKRSAPLNKIPPKAKSPLAYLKGVK